MRAKECKLSCARFPHIYGLGLCLLTPALCPCIGPIAPQQRRKYTATGNITEIELLEPWVAVAPIELGQRDARALTTTTP